MVLIGDSSVLFFVKIIVFIAKIIVSALVFMAVQAFSYWAVYAQIFPFGVASSLPALLTAVAAAVWVWRGMGAAEWGILTTAAIWAVVTGALGFCVGFYGAMIAAPGANQGPLAGFVFGPLGFIAGGICGALWHKVKAAVM